MIETSPAVCCWCQSPLKRMDAESPWMCWTRECWDRMRPWGMATQRLDRKGRPKLHEDGTPALAEWLFMPTPKQVQFAELQRVTKFTLFGGAKAVAKSYLLRYLLYRECVRIPGLRCLLLRRTFPELESTHLLEMPAEAERLQPVGATYRSGAREFSFGNGSLIRAGHCETDADVAKFLSTQWDIIAFDELVTFLLDQFLAIASCARTVKEAVKAEGGAKVWAATNPGGRGARWVKELFVDHAPDLERFPNYDASQWGYVPGLVDDNPYVEAGYKQTLLNLPPVLRRQWLYGDWDAFEGQFFDWMAQKDGHPWHVADLGLVA